MIGVDVSMCQSAVRQYLAMRKLEDLRHRRNEACATMVEAQWRCFTVRREFVKTVAKVVYLQSILRRWRSEKTRARLITGKKNTFLLLFMSYLAWIIHQ